jgi:hypothetical protein
MWRYFDLHQDRLITCPSYMSMLWQAAMLMPQFRSLTPVVFLENLASSELLIFSAQLVIPRKVGVSTQLWLKYGKLASQQSEYAFDDFCFNDLHWIVVLWISCRLTNMHWLCCLLSYCNSFCASLWALGLIVNPSPTRTSWSVYFLHYSSAVGVNANDIAVSFVSQFRTLTSWFYRISGHCCLSMLLIITQVLSFARRQCSNPLFGIEAQGGPRPADSSVTSHLLKTSHAACSHNCRSWLATGSFVSSCNCPGADFNAV